MAKVISFGENEQDKKLIKQIMIYQKRKNLKSFSQAGRQLCETGLQVEEIKKK